MIGYHKVDVEAWVDVVHKGISVIDPGLLYQQLT